MCRAGGQFSGKAAVSEHVTVSRVPTMALSAAGPWWRRPRRRWKTNRYAGVRVGRSGRIPTVDAALLHDPPAFFERFVARRCPCVLRGELPELAAHAVDWWSSPNARARPVDVEVRDGPSDSYGRGRKVHMTFGQLYGTDLNPRFQICCPHTLPPLLCAGSTVARTITI